MPERPVSSRVSVTFRDETDDIDIILELSSEWSRQNEFGWQSIREFPRLNGVNRSASVGTIIDTGYVQQLTRNEIIRFDGDEGSVRYPFDSSTVITDVLFSFDLDGDNLSAGALSFSTTSGSKTLKANRPFIGAVRVEYYATYRLLAYLPQGGNTGGSGDFGTVGDIYWRNFGTVISVKDSNFAILEIDAQGIDQETFTLRKELYRVTSTVQVNESGAWEKSPDFDSGGGWSDPSSPRDGDSIFEYERVHEIGYLIRGFGRVDYETTTVFTEQGPSGSFDAVLSYKEQGASNFSGTPWEDAYTRINPTVVRADAQSRFPTDFV